MGNVIGPHPNKLYDLVINKIINSFNGLNAVLRKDSVNAIYHLFKTFCTKLYGSLFWDLSSGKVTSLYTLWYKCLRKLLDLPYTTHSGYIPLIAYDVPVKVKKSQ